jgi:hypothetical protein
MSLVLLFKITSFISLIVAVLGPVGAVIAVVLFPTIALPVLKRLWSAFLECRLCMLVVAVLIACQVSFWIGRGNAYKEGEADAIAGIARNDTKLVGKAKAARTKLLDCQAQGRRWDQTTGACR